MMTESSPYKQYKHLRSERQPVLLAYESNQESEVLLARLQKFILESFSNAKLQVVEVGKSLYAVGFTEGINSIFVDALLEAKRVFCNEVQPNPIVPDQSFLKAVSKYFNLTTVCEVYCHLERELQLLITGFEPANDSSLIAQDYVYHTIVDGYQVIPLLQTNWQVSEFTPVFAESETVAVETRQRFREQGYQLDGRILLGEEYSCVLLSSVVNLNQQFWRQCLGDTQLISSWQHLLRQIRLQRSCSQAIIACDACVYCAGNLENLIDDLLELDALLASGIKLLYIQHRGQILFPYAQSQYRDRVTKPSGEFCLRLAKVPYQALSVAEVQFCLQQLLSLRDVVCNKFEMIHYLPAPAVESADGQATDPNLTTLELS